MDAVRETYYETVATRSVQKNSARHKANGSAVTKLGNKPVTTKEIYDKHGPIITFPSTDNFMSYSDFVRLSPDLKVEFVNKMMDRYDISLKYISRHLFNKGDDGLRAMMDKWKLLKQVDMKKKRGDADESIRRFREEVFDWQERTKKAKETDRIQNQMRKESCPTLITYDAFKKLTPDQQADFINRVIKYYQVTATMIAIKVFGIRGPSLYNHFQRVGITKKIENLPSKVSRNHEIMYENEKKFERFVSAWKDFSNEVEEEPPVEEKVIDIQPMFRQLTKEEGHEVINESLRKITEMSESEIQKKAQDILSTPSNPVRGAIPPDSEFELDDSTVQHVLDGAKTMVDRMKERRVSKWYQCFGDADAVDFNHGALGIYDLKKTESEPIQTEQLDLYAALSAEEPEAEPTPAAEPDPMEYHQMHFSTNYISSEINMDEIYAIAAFFKRSKRVKVSIEISEV